ncbi:MAG: DegV family protein [Nitriliruptoraceae bacterium]
MGRIAVVTDATADLPDRVVRRRGLHVVPLSVTFGDETFVAGETITADEFYGRLATSRTPPMTSQPTPVDFARCYADIADEGYDRIVSIHCSSELSGTFDVARTQAPKAPVPVEVVDSRVIGASLGLAVLAAADVIDSDGEVADALAAVAHVRDRGVGLLVVDTLEFLKRGGRLSGPQAAIGTALRVKPLLHLTDGRVEIRERTRTWARARDRVVEIVAGLAASGPVDIAIVHAVGAQHAMELRSAITHRADAEVRFESVIGPIVGTHVGPGAIGVAAVPSTVR